jgi:hypothetical protein
MIIPSATSHGPASVDPGFIPGRFFFTLVFHPLQNIPIMLIIDVQN